MGMHGIYSDDMVVTTEILTSFCLLMFIIKVLQTAGAFFCSVRVFTSAYQNSIGDLLEATLTLNFIFNVLLSPVWMSARSV